MLQLPPEELTHLLLSLSCWVRKDKAMSIYQQEYKRDRIPFFDFANSDFPVAVLRGGMG